MSGGGDNVVRLPLPCPIRYLEDSVGTKARKRLNGADLRWVREKRFGESQRVFAENTGIGEATVQRYEAAPESEVPLFLAWAIAARLEGLKPFRSDDPERTSSQRRRRSS